MHVNTLTNLMKISPQALVPSFMAMIKENFRKPALTMVTQREYSIMQTPDGEAFNQSVYERFFHFYYLKINFIHKLLST